MSCTIDDLYLLEITKEESDKKDWKNIFSMSPCVEFFRAHVKESEDRIFHLFSSHKIHNIELKLGAPHHIVEEGFHPRMWWLDLEDYNFLIYADVKDGVSLYIEKTHKEDRERFMSEVALDFLKIYLGLVE